MNGSPARKTELFRASGVPDLPAENEKNAAPEIAMLARDFRVRSDPPYLIQHPHI